MKKYFNKEFILIIFCFATFVAFFGYLLYVKEYGKVICILGALASFFFGRYSMKKDIRQYIDVILNARVITKDAYTTLKSFKYAFLVSKKEADQYMDNHWKEVKRILEEQNESFH